MPFESYQVFQRGGYFSVEVIPEQLAVISLNTMYFYDSNKGACANPRSRSDSAVSSDVWFSVNTYNMRYLR